MENKLICPDCGFEFKQGDGNANYCYENGITYYTCPDCGWEGTNNEVIDDNEIGELD